MKLLGVVGALAALLAPVSASAAPEIPEPVEVMVVGSWHFAGSSQDLLSFKTDDVREPRRQAELETLADALAEFRPTKVMVERVAPAPDLFDPGYASFTAEALGRDRNERVQIGYRLARKLGHPHVYAIDEQSTGTEPDYFPFGKLLEYDRAKGTGELPQRMPSVFAGMVRTFNESRRRCRCRRFWRNGTRRIAMPNGSACTTTCSRSATRKTSPGRSSTPITTCATPRSSGS